MLERIKIDTMRDYLIAEKLDDGFLARGTNVFCGCCGRSVGIIKKKLKIPFMPEAFLDALKDKSIDWMVFGLRHKSCGHTMFPFKNSFDFISLDNYMKSQKKTA